MIKLIFSIFFTTFSSQTFNRLNLTFLMKSFKFLNFFKFFKTLTRYLFILAFGFYLIPFIYQSLEKHLSWHNISGNQKIKFVKIYNILKNLSIINIVLEYLSFQYEPIDVLTFSKYSGKENYKNIQN